SKLTAIVEKDAKLRSTAGGKLLIKDKFFEEFNLAADKLVAANVDAKSQKTMIATIKSRAAMLDGIEKMAAKAIESKDWSMQVVALTVLGRESQRFYEELFSLPMPEGLNEAEQSEYMNLLSQQAAPYKTKADMAGAKSAEFWSQNWKPALQSSLENTLLRPLIAKEIQALEKVASVENAQVLKGQLEIAQTQKSTGNIQASFKAVEEMRNKLRNNPLDIKLAQELLSAEKIAGNKVMVQYLEGRIALLTDSQNEVK
ncbi:MAG: hypothetical protein ACLGGX_12165, partial [Bdellovibrionia bacterium]